MTQASPTPPATRASPSAAAANGSRPAAAAGAAFVRHLDRELAPQTPHGEQRANHGHGHDRHVVPEPARPAPAEPAAAGGPVAGAPATGAAGSEAAPPVILSFVAAEARATEPTAPVVAPADAGVAQPSAAPATPAVPAGPHGAGEHGATPATPAVPHTGGDHSAAPAVPAVAHGGGDDGATPAVPRGEHTATPTPAAVPARAAVPAAGPAPGGPAAAPVAPQNPAATAPVGPRPATATAAAATAQPAPAQQEHPAEPAAPAAPTATNGSAAPAATSSAAPAASTAPAQASPEPHRAVRLAQAAETVQLTISSASAAGVSRARIALRPEALGGIEIMLSHGPGGLTAVVTADSPAAAQALQRAADELQRSLADQGLSLVRLDIDVAGDRAAARGRDDHDRGLHRGHDRRDPDATVEDDATPIGERTLELSDGVLVDVLA